MVKSILVVALACSWVYWSCRAGQRCFCLWGFINDPSESMPGRSQARRLKGRKKFQTCDT